MSPATEMSRDALLRLASTPNASWTFLPRALAVLDAGDRDPEILALVAAHAIRLGLRTLALDAIGALPGEYQDDPQVVALRTASEALKRDAIAPETRIRTTNENLAHLGHAAEPLRAHLDAWSRRVASTQAFLTSDRNRILRDDPSRAFRFRLFADASSAAFSAWKPSADAATDPTGERPVLIAGFASAALLRRVLDATRPTSAGYSPRIWVFEPDPIRALDAFSIADASSAFAHERIVWALGPSAPEKLRDDLHSRFGEQLPDVVTTDPLGGDASPAASILSQARAAQREEHDRLHASLASTPRSFACRRIVVATSRYSTFMRHSANDLVAALRAQGREVDLLTEPDDHAKLSSVGYLRAFESFRPDAVLLINYTRASLPSAIPDALPCVTWIQDSMAHLFEEDSLDALRAHDVVVGHVGRAMSDRLRVRSIATLQRSVPASEHKFVRTAPSSFTCDVAYVSHQSESPEQMRSRLLRGTPPGRSRDLLDAALERAASFARAPLNTLAANAVPSSITDAAISLGIPPIPPDAVRDLTLRAVLPYAERVFRHETLEWARDICARRGWRLRLFGRGWESHPSLSAHASGALEHGDALRECYASSRVHLHASLMTSLHQRVFECLLSGGLPLCRATFADTHASVAAALALACERLGETPPLDRDRFRSCFAGRLQEFPEFREIMRVLPTFGSDMPLGGLLWRINGAPVGETGPRSLGSPVHVLGEVDRMMFTDLATLESLLERAISSPEWRTDTVEHARTRVVETHSYAAFARDLLRLLDQRAAATVPVVQPTS
jgi:hypothetical protein